MRHVEGRWPDRATWLPLLLCAALAGCGDADQAPAASRSPAIGLVANSIGYGARLGVEQDLARRAGARWLREGFAWGQVEPAPRAREWGQLDRLMANAARRRLRVLPVLLAPPRWAVAAGTGLPRDPAPFAAFAADVAARYGPDGAFWRTHGRLDGRLAPRWFELFNEPYLASGAGGPVSAARYAALAAAAASAGRAANPRTRYLLAADARAATPTGVDTAWLDELLGSAPELLRVVDGVAAHPYARDAGRALRNVDALRAELARRGLGAPVWITEIGWSTCRRDPVCVSEDRQARDLRRLLAGVRRRGAGAIAATFVYHLRSWSVPAAEAREGEFGLLRRDGTPKPAWRVFRRNARTPG
jgi:hypothetical protein